MSRGESASHGKHKRSGRKSGSVDRGLRASEERYRSLADNIPMGVLTCDSAGHITSINRNVLEMFGLSSPDAVLSVNLLTFKPLVDSGIAGDVAFCLSTGQPVLRERQYVCIGDARKSLRYSLTSLQGQDGIITGAQGIFDDVTGRMLAGEALAGSEARLRVLFENAAAAIVLVDAATGEIIDCNSILEQLIGHARDELIGRPIDWLHPPENMKERGDDVRKEASRGLLVNIEDEILHRDGRHIPVLLSLRPLEIDHRLMTLGIIVDITERKRSEAALRASEAQFRALTEMASAAVCIVQDGHFIYVNPAMVAMSGYAKEELLAMDFRTLIHPDVAAVLQPRYEDWLRGANDEARYELKGITKGGEVRWVDVGRKTISYGGRPALLFSGVDVTDRKQALDALRSSEERYRNLAESVYDWVWEIGASGLYTYASPRVRELLGYEPDEVAGKSPFCFMAPDEAARVSGIFEKIIANREPFELLENRLVRKDGGEVIVETSGMPVFDWRGRFAGYRGTDRDVTQRRKAEAALRDSEERLRLCVAAGRLGTLDWDPVRDRHVWSPEIFEIFGLTPDTRLTLDLITDTIFPGDRQDAIFAAGMNPAGTGEFAMEYRITRASDGAIRWVYQTMRVIFEGSGSSRHAVRVLGVVQDITDRKEAEIALRESEEKFRVLAETMHAGVALYRADRFIYVNPVLEELSGYTRDEVMQMRFWDLVHPDYRDLVRERGLARQRGEPVPAHYEACIMAKSGEVKWLEFSAATIRYLGEPTGIVTLYDITDRRRAELALSEAKANAELYLDLIGHDISNMNQITMGFIEIACGKLASTGRLEGGDIFLLEKALESVQNSSSLIRNVRRLQQARLGMYKPEVLDLGKLLREVVEQHRDVPDRDVVITCTVESGCYVEANGLLKDVFINLLGNAVKHSTGPLEITVTLSGEMVDERTFWRIVIEDNGPGIPDSRKKTLFDRLSLSASRARGKGFGLCLIKLLIDDYRGRFWVEDRVPGDHTQGARFIVVLPAAE